MQSTEQWLPVPGYEGHYEVSDHGKVRSIERLAWNGVGMRRVPSRELKQTARSDGRLHVKLSRHNRTTDFLVHRLVLTSFVGPCPPGLECCHGDADPANNHLDNLRWDTSQENSLDTIRHGHHRESAKTHCKRGHQLVAPNLKPAQYAAGARSCLACAREYALARSQDRPFDTKRADDRYRELGFDL